MPRNQIAGGRGKRNYKHFTEEAVISAIDAVKRKGMSLRRASEMFSVPKSTLAYRAKLADDAVPQVGRPCVFTQEEEEIFAQHLVTVANWGFPFSKLDLRYLVKAALDSTGKTVTRFKDNLPGDDWAISFMQRHTNILSSRMCQNIGSKRAKVTPEDVMSFFHNFEESKDVPSSHILNYDETNLTDDPGRQKLIFRRGCKYPERVLNSTKSATSVMFAGTAAGDLLPPYIVYKAQNMWEQWTNGGPDGAHYNRSLSGWFDEACFQDWFQSIVVPWAKRLEGKKVLIGDNLSSHFSKPVLDACSRLNISFICLPPNAAHIMQPLDVGFYGPLKRYWREILLDWKTTSGRKFTSLPKDKFPELLGKLYSKLQEQNRATKNLKSGFRACGLHPVDADRVLKKVPAATQKDLAPSVSDAVITMLNNMRNETPRTVKQRKKVDVAPGKSITAADLRLCDIGVPKNAADKRSSSVSGPSGTDSHLERVQNKRRKTNLNKEVSTKLPQEYSSGNWVVVQYEGRKELQKLCWSNN